MTTRRLLILGIVLGSIACTRTEPATSRATLQIRTTGLDGDLDGYLVTLVDTSSSGGRGENGSYGLSSETGRGFRMAPNDTRSIAISNSVSQVNLYGIAPNCIVDGGAKRPIRPLVHDTVTFLVACQEIEQRLAVPDAGEWRLAGVALRPDSDTQRWDSRLDGMITPAAVVKSGDRYLLYYIGADGDRSTDRGPRNRALGVAISSDGISFERLDEPILRHQPNGNEEEGIFSAAVLDDGTGLAIVYGGMTAPNATSESVDGAAILSHSPDGISVDPGITVIDPADPTVYNHGDEIFPIAGFQDPSGEWHVYYVAKGRSALWTLGVASGPQLRSLPKHSPALDLRPDWISAGGNPQLLSRHELAFSVVTNSNHTRGSTSGSDGLDNVVEIRSVSIHRPADLTTVLARYALPAEQAILLRDDQEERWLLYTLSSVDQSVNVYSAPFQWEIRGR